MNETIKCSIAGIAFTLEKKAYARLDAYLKALKNIYPSDEGEEIISDIESRIVEILLSHQNPETPVTEQAIEEVITQMGTIDEITAEDNARPESAAEEPQPILQKHLYRNLAQASLAGICSGLGSYFSLDPVFIRIGFLAPLIIAISSSFFIHDWWVTDMMYNIFWTFLLIYLILWFTVPAARTARHRLEMEGIPVTSKNIANDTLRTETNEKARTILGDLVTLLGRIAIFFVKLFMVGFLLLLGAIAAALICSLYLLLRSNDIDMVLLLGIFLGLLPVILLIYLNMNLIFATAINGKAVKWLMGVWLALLVAICALLPFWDKGEGFFKSFSDNGLQLGYPVNQYNRYNKSIEELSHQLEEIETPHTNPADTLPSK